LIIEEIDDIDGLNLEGLAAAFWRYG
jgi:hypothetical protein